MSQTIKINVSGRSRKGHVKKKHILIFSVPDHMDRENSDNLRNSLKEFEKNDQKIAVLHLPPDAKFKVIHF